MAQNPLSGVKACLFDAYGTLFDFASAARACEELSPDTVDKLTALWRDKQLQYTWLRAAQDRHADFWQVTADALDFALETLAIERTGVRDQLPPPAGKGRDYGHGFWSQQWLGLKRMVEFSSKAAN